MKKLTFLGTMLLAAALIFTGCKDTKDETSAYSDCTEDATTVELSAGTWTLTTTNTTSTGRNDMVATATVDEEGNYTFTSITQTAVSTVPDEYKDAWAEMNDAQKKEFLESMSPEGAQVSFSGNTVKMVYTTTDATELAMFASSFDLEELAGAVEEGFASIKTNSDKTKYVITVTDEDGETSTLYISKN